MIPKEYECREGNGIKLFINSESNYGLSHYEPRDEEDIQYQKALKLKELFDNSPDEQLWRLRDKDVSRETYLHFLHCLSCKAEKINNFERYCSLCEDYDKEIWR